MRKLARMAQRWPGWERSLQRAGIFAAKLSSRDSKFKFRFAIWVITVNVGAPASGRVWERDRDGGRESKPDPLAPGELARERTSGDPTTFTSVSASMDFQDEIKSSKVGMEPAWIGVFSADMVVWMTSLPVILATFI
ncbi:hypothetical protein FB451DRAFT_1182870 [Mycena latifolia]|nr:hypothetical protein FB451DRAFT_1182870 [Mycena latifolia]